MSEPAEWWAPPLRSMGTGHRVAGYPGMRPVRTRDLPGDVPGLGLVARWRARLVFGLAEYPMRWAAREMGRLPARCHDMTEPEEPR